MSPSPEAWAVPVAYVRMSPRPFASDVEPLTLTVTIGSITPISSLSVTPIRPAMTTVVAVSLRFAVPERESVADGAVIERTCMPLNV